MLVSRSRQGTRPIDSFVTGRNDLIYWVRMSGNPNQRETSPGFWRGLFPFSLWTTPTMSPFSFGRSSWVYVRNGYENAGLVQNILEWLWVKYPEGLDSLILSCTTDCCASTNEIKYCSSALRFRNWTPIPM